MGDKFECRGKIIANNKRADISIRNGEDPYYMLSFDDDFARIQGFPKAVPMAVGEQIRTMFNGINPIGNDVMVIFDDFNSAAGGLFAAIPSAIQRLNSINKPS